MSLADDFKNAGSNAAYGYRFKKSYNNDFTLNVEYSGAAGTLYYTYDFLARVVVVQAGKEVIGAMVPFDNMDPESIEFFREKLVELKGKPPALPHMSQRSINITPIKK